MSNKYVYNFGGGKADGNAAMKDLLGGKGANLAEMAGLGIPVPPGFTISTDVCTYYYDHDETYPKELAKEVEKAVKRLEKIMNAGFGDKDKPLLLSIRSGARVSMPGMMDTVLNLGLNDETVLGLIKMSGDERFAYDCYRRFIQMYSEVVLTVDSDHFEHLIDEKKREKNVKLDTELTADDWKELIVSFKKVVSDSTDRQFPDDPREQLWGGIGAVFGSWNNKRAIDYRNINKIPHHWGTAVNVQTMVFGNMGDDSATGVAFTRDPSTGEKVFYGEFLRNAQGEDVVAGIRTPQPINVAGKKEDAQETLEELFPECYKQLEEIYQRLERHYKDMQDIEFTIQTGRLWMLQTRNGKRTAAAAVKIAVDMVNEKLIDKKTAVLRVQPSQLDQLLHPRLDPKAPKEVIARGLPASPGAAVGRAVFSADDAEVWAKNGEKVVLVRTETSPDDIHGMNVCQGILTARGGMTCVSGSTKILTSMGFISAEAAYDHFSESGAFKIFSYDTDAKKGVWRTVIAAGKRRSRTVTVNVSQTGRSRNNTLCLTDDHKMFTVENRKLIKKPLRDVIRDGQYICVPDKIPGLSNGSDDGDAAYLAGAIFTDGQGMKNNIAGFILGLDEESLWRFLAGVVDGKGAFSKDSSRVNINVAKKWLLEGIVLACLRLGISPRITKRRDINNVQIVERLEELFMRTKRVGGAVQKQVYGTKLFSARSLFMYVWERMNKDGKMGEIIKKNLLIDKERVYRDYVPMCNPKEELKAVLESDFRMQKIEYKDGRTSMRSVYNFEVDADEDIDKNFVVFTDNYVPVLVSNSHAAVVARGMGKCCVAGCPDIKIDYNKKQMEVRGGAVLKEGDWITLDGTAGQVIMGRVPTIDPKLSGEFGTLMEWVDGFRKLKIRTNADTPHDSQVAIDFGAEGIGLCRTEHMFFEGERIDLFREMIVAEDKDGRKKALAKLLPIQKDDFKGIFKVMKGLPVTVRLLDPPLHEFLPHTEGEIAELAAKIGIDEGRLKGKVESLKEFNPMLGHRGCRLGITYPEIYAMQVQAIMEAVCELKKEEGIDSLPEIEIPLVGHVNELKYLRGIVTRVCEEVIAKENVKVNYLIGTMIELVRAAVTADRIAEYADFFSFGTNDLTQTTFGLSRDDAGRFLGEYVEKHILPVDPFVSIDRDGVGEMMKMTVQKGRTTKKGLEIGICGEHGGDPSSVEFCNEIGLNYVSCSPYRVPIARLAAAQAALKS